MVCETTQVPQFISYDPGNRADARDSFNGVGHGANEPLEVEIQLGEPLLEEAQLCDHRVDKQIQSWIPVPGSQAFCSRLFKRLGFGCTKSAATGTRYQAPCAGAEKARRSRRRWERLPHEPPGGTPFRRPKDLRDGTVKRPS